MASLGTRTLVITIGGTDYTASVSKAVITSGEADADFVTFTNAAAGGAREYRLEFTAAQDPVGASLWNTVFTAAGTSVACVLKPYGNTTASPTQPHFTFNAVVAEPDGDFVGGEANSSESARMTFDCSWILDAKPVKVVA
ncbi:hypothetical protein [Nocardioides antri]|uniref:Uncharacterized protein n=1 Tax=Nocardioides antri TaxID=2607659 RepID=A0A5B1LUG2_9ACTN|nr:hypothetical protein [Nocardioides antri]KAA1424312.1 hypothetical protein F0U47_18945 [Nocardioides antri]